MQKLVDTLMLETENFIPNKRLAMHLILVKEVSHVSKFFKYSQLSLTVC